MSRSIKKEIGEDGRGRMWSAKKNAARKIEVIENNRIYYCNDGDEDEDFERKDIGK